VIFTWRGGSRGRGGVAHDPVSDDGEARAHLHCVALWNENLTQDARGWRGNLSVDLVGRYFEQRLVAVHCLSDGLHPTSDRPFGDRLTELWHRDVRQGAVPFRLGQALSRRRSPTVRGGAVRTGRPRSESPPS